MSFWSISCIASKEVYIREADVVLGTGLNVFTVVAPDIAKFLEGMAGQGVSRISYQRLDDHEAIDATSVQLQAASPGLLSPG